MPQAILSPWTWDTRDPAFPFWRGPDDLLGGIDLRPLPAQALAGGTPEGVGLFVLPDAAPLPDGAILLGALDGGLTPARRTVDSFLALPQGSVASLTVADLIAELILMHGDPTGQTRWKPLRGGFHNGVPIYLNGLLRKEAFSHAHPAWANTLAVYQADYREKRAWIDTLPSRQADAAFEALQRYTGYMRLAYRLGDEYAVLLPDEYKDEGYRDPRTTIGDTFVEGSDTALVDHTATGPNGGFGWTQDDGAMTVVAVSNTLRSDGTGGNVRARAGGVLSSDDMYGEFVVLAYPGASTRNIGPRVRAEAAADTSYMLSLRNTATDTYRLFKITTGTFSQIGSSVSATPPGTPFVERIEVDGSSLEGFIDEVSKIGPETDLSFTGQVRAGIWAGGGAQVDDFESADLAAAAGRVMGALAGHGGLAGAGGLAGQRGGLAS